MSRGRSRLVRVSGEGASFPILKRLRRLDLTLDLAVLALGYGAYAWLLAPKLFRGYCTDGPAPTTMAYETADLLQREPWLIAAVLGGFAFIELRWTLRPWVTRGVRFLAGLGLALLIAVPWLWWLSLAPGWQRNVPGPMQMYGHGTP